jgi:hypothetical protein
MTPDATHSDGGSVDPKRPPECWQCLAKGPWNVADHGRAWSRRYDLAYQLASGSVIDDSYRLEQSLVLILPRQGTVFHFIRA